MHCEIVNRQILRTIQPKEKLTKNLGINITTGYISHSMIEGSLVKALNIHSYEMNN